MKTFSCALACILLVPVLAAAQAPATPPAPVPRLSVTSTAWPDGGEIPMRHAARGDNKSPAFEFHWFLGTAPTTVPSTVQSYAVIFHDIENSTMRGTADTLHWAAFNIPGNAAGLPEGLGSGDLPDGTINGPGIARRTNNGPGASLRSRRRARSISPLRVRVLCAGHEADPAGNDDA